MDLRGHINDLLEPYGLEQDNTFSDEGEYGDGEAFLKKMIDLMRKGMPEEIKAQITQKLQTESLYRIVQAEKFTQRMASIDSKFELLVQDVADTFMFFSSEKKWIVNVNGIWVERKMKTKRLDSFLMKVDWEYKLKLIFDRENQFLEALKDIRDWLEELFESDLIEQKMQRIEEEITDCLFNLIKIEYQKESGLSHIE